MESETKRCSKCKAFWTLEGFQRSGPILKSTGLQAWSSWCRLCQRTYARLKYQSRPDLQASHAERYRQKTRDVHLLKTYGISEADYNLIHVAQGGCCKICGQPQLTQWLAVDHDHKTGRVRGLLCSRCNLAVGWFEDLDHVERIMDYLSAARDN